MELAESLRPRWNLNRGPLVGLVGWCRAEVVRKCDVACGHGKGYAGQPCYQR